MHERNLFLIFFEPNKVTIVVLSQKEGYNAAYADYLRKSVYEQADALEKVRLITTKLLPSHLVFVKFLLTLHLYT